MDERTDRAQEGDMPDAGQPDASALLSTVIDFEGDLLDELGLLRAVLDSIGEGVVVADTEGHFLAFNPAAERILMMAPQAVPYEEHARRYGLYLPDKFTPCPVDQNPLVRASRGESVDESEMYVNRRDLPEGIWISVTTRPLTDQEDAVRGGVAVFRDISDRKKAEEITRVLQP